MSPSPGRAESPVDSSPQRFVVDVPQQLLLVDERGAPLEVAGVHVLEVQDGPKFEVTLPQS